MMIRISRSSSNTSIGGSHAACAGDEAARWKKRRCSRSASSIMSQACAHIHSVGSVRLGMGLDPLQQLLKIERTRLARDFAAVAKRDQRRNAANGVASGDRLLGLGVELRESNSRRYAG